MKLIADSGSTKTSWRLDGKPIETMGINPVRDSSEQIASVLDQLPNEEVTEVYFYGAGCIAPYSTKLESALKEKFPNAQISVESDMLGAARALCGRHEGIACILGTGSNSCLYDGERIIQNVSPLGYILGDEGSGASLGKHLVGDLLKNQLSQELKESFLKEFSLTPADIIDKVYRQPMPNRFLASLVPFLGRHREEKGIQELIISEFRRFLKRNVAQYGRPDLSINFVGGIAGSYGEELKAALDAENMKMGKILQAPIDEMLVFHTENA